MIKRVTISDVARAVGVTHGTVSRVIHNNPRISRATKTRVRKAIREMGYRPNLIARGLATNKSFVIAAIVPELDPSVQQILRTVTDICRHHDYSLMVASTEYSENEDVAYRSVVDRWQVDGVLIYNVIPQSVPTPEALEILRQGPPIVFINRYIYATNVCAVGVDNYAAAKLAVDHLVRLGHTRIGMLKGSVVAADAMERHEGFVRAMKYHGLDIDPSIVARANYIFVDGIMEMRKMLQLPSPPTALFCANDLMALGACRAIEEAGLRVPDDISLVGFDDNEAAIYHHPSITTLRPPLPDVGRKAVKMLMDRISDPSTHMQQIPCQPKLIVRESTGPCPSTRDRRKPSLDFISPDSAPDTAGSAS
jgi:LacI family transcriptional regulator, repressor for deo operon, udp, cdd, tsx, nupC, and nupG